MNLVSKMMVGLAPILAVLALALSLGACTRPRTDTTITAAVKQDLTLAHLPETIVVATNDGVVILTGSVTDASTKQHAERVAFAVHGVRGVVNKLQTTMAGDAPEQPNGAPPAANVPYGRPPETLQNAPQKPSSGDVPAPHNALPPDIQ